MARSRPAAVTGMSAAGRVAARPGVPWEVPAVWVLFGVVAVAILVTYARLPAYELYHVSRSGLAGGAGRVLVDLNWPLALVALPILAIVPGRVPLRITAAVLCGVVFAPGIVQDVDLDAKPLNAVPAAGVLLAVAASWRRPLVGGPRVRGDTVRIAAAAVIVIAAVPWIAADLGTSILGSDALWAPFGDPVLEPKVHPGHHHGMVGALAALAALLLSRPLPQIEQRKLRIATSVYLGVLLAYGIGNELQDFWYEQLVKRGVLSYDLPRVVEPGPTAGWAVILAAALLFAALFLRGARRPSGGAGPRPAGRAFLVAAGGFAAAGLAAIAATAAYGGGSSTGPETPLRSAEVTGTLVFSMTGRHKRDLFRLKVPPGDPQAMVDERGDDSNPAWSRAGRLVFQSNTEGGAELWSSNTVSARRLTDAQGSNGEPASSPDGREIAFSSTRSGTADLYILDLADGLTLPLTRGAADDEWPAWSPDGSRIAFERDGDLYLIGADGAGLHRLTSGAADDRLPAWSPDGRAIAFARATSGNVDLYLVRLDATTRRLTRDPAEDTAPSWSADGRLLAFVSNRDGRQQLYLLDTGSGRVDRLTAEDRDKGRPAWG